MFSKIFYARLDTSHHGPLHPFKDTGVVADSLTGIHNAMVKCLLVANMSCIHVHKDFRCPHRYNSRRFKCGERGGHAVGPPLPIHRS
jgi:hypothetical protein